MNKAAAPLVMSAGQRESLLVLARSSTAAHRQVQRAKVLLMAGQGVANSQIAASVGVTPTTVRSWRARFASEGLAKFAQVREGRGRKPVLSAEKIEEIVRLTQHEKPSGATHWSCRSMAKAVGVSPATVQRIWSGRGLRPHLVKTFKLSNDPAPTSSSWLNLVERWFRELTDKAIRRGVFHSVPDLITAIEKYMEVHNNEPKPLVWTATAESILTKVRRGRVALDQAVSQ